MYNNYGYLNEFPSMQGIQNSESFGMHIDASQMQLDYSLLQSLGFTQIEIDTLQFIIANGGKVTIAALTNYGIDYESARRFKYMFDISTGKVAIESIDDLVKHLRKMFGMHRRIGITDLALSKIQRVPRKAVIAGIKDETFSIYNSSQYPVNERMYNVTEISNGRIFIETNKKPVLKYKQPKKIHGIIELVELKEDGKVIVAVDKQYARLCNRFIIVASLRKPEFHHGMIEIICIEGTRVYVYAHNMGVRDTVRYNGGTQRVYDYGFLPSEIQQKLMLVVFELYPKLFGVYASAEAPNSDFQIITKEEEHEESIEEQIEE